MDFVIPYTKEITFDSKIVEIDSISLEHDISVNDTEILGNFIITGEYKTHELSVNKEAFEHTIPFSIDLPTNIDKDTINFEITDFTYEIEGNDTLKVIIEVSLKADELEEKRKDVFEKIEEDIKPIEDIKEEEREDQIEDVSNDNIIDSLTLDDDEYLTYHVHIYKDNENLEALCKLYNSNMNLLSDYNDLNNLKNNDKLLIVEEDE